MTPEEAAAVLGVKADSDMVDIDLAYRRRARLSHPDRFAGAPQTDVRDATAEFVRIGIARDVLRKAGRDRNNPKRPTRDNAARPEPMSFDAFCRKFEEAAWGPVPSGSVSEEARHPSSPSRQASDTNGNGPETYVYSPGVQRPKTSTILLSLVGIVSIFLLVLVVVAVDEATRSSRTVANSESDAEVGGAPATSKVAELVGADITESLTLAWSQEDVSSCSANGCAALNITAPSSLRCARALVEVGFSTTEAAEPTQFTEKQTPIGPGPRQLVFQFPPNDSFQWIVVSRIKCVEAW